MKKFVIISSIVVLCFSLLTAAYADVIWEPTDAYWWKNPDACIRLGGIYIMNGPEGYVPVYADPTDKSPSLYLPNGGEFVIAAYAEADGKKMGVIQYKTTDTGEIVHSWGGDVEAFYAGPDDFSIEWTKEGSGTGWLDMDMVIKEYDTSTFEKEFESQLTKGEYIFEHDLDPGTDICIWNYPGAKTPQGSLTIKTADDSNGNELTFSTLFTDENGNEWGKIDYYYGLNDYWVCITDPTNRSLPVREVKYDLVPASNDFPAISPADKNSPEFPYLAVILVASVVIITAILIAFLYRKNRPAGNGGDEKDRSEQA